MEVTGFTYLSVVQQEIFQSPSQRLEVRWEWEKTREVSKTEASAPLSYSSHSSQRTAQSLGTWFMCQIRLMSNGCLRPCLDKASGWLSGEESCVCHGEKGWEVRKKHARYVPPAASPCYVRFLQSPWDTRKRAAGAQVPTFSIHQGNSSAKHSSPV